MRRLPPLLAILLASCSAFHPRPPFGPTVQRVEAPHFDLRTDCLRPTPVDLARVAEEVRSAVLVELPDVAAEMADERIRLEVFQREEDFRTYALAHGVPRGDGFTCSFGEVALYHPVTSMRVPNAGEALTADDFQVEEDDVEVFRYRLAHEMVHRAFKHGRFDRLPDWAQEGICDWIGFRTEAVPVIHRFSSEVTLFIDFLHGVRLWDPARRGEALDFCDLPARNGDGPHATGRVAIGAIASDPELEARLREGISLAFRGPGFSLSLGDRFATRGAFEDWVPSRWEADFLARFSEALSSTPELLEADEYAALARLLMPGMRRRDLAAPHKRFRARLATLAEGCLRGDRLSVAGLLGGSPDVYTRWARIAPDEWKARYPREQLFAR